MIRFRINRDYKGPTLMELEPCLDEVEGTVEVRWECSRTDLAVLERHSARDFILYIPDTVTMERTCTALGQPLDLDPQMVEAARVALLSRKEYNWRGVNEKQPMPITRAVVTKITAEALRKGKHPKLAEIARDVMLEGIAPIDTDVLLRLRVMRG